MTSRVSILLIFSTLVWSCYQGEGGKPTAIGTPGKINVILPAKLKNGPVGRVLDSIFTADLEVFPRDEQMFTLRYVNPEDINRSQKNIRNIIFGFTFTDMGSEAGRIKSLIEPESLNALRNDTAAFVHTQSNVFAKGQEIMYLFAADEKTLLKKIMLNTRRLTGHFNEKERIRLRTGVVDSRSNDKLAESLAKRYGFRLSIPIGYQVADQQDDFLWLRQINPADDKDIWISRRKFSSMKDFELPNLIQYRNDVCRRYLFEDPEEPETFLVTEERITSKKPISRTINFNGMYAVEVRGLWKTNIPSMGGPFVGYAFVNEKEGLLYYAEGFTFCPSKPQREIMRELEVILGTLTFTGRKASNPS